MAAVLDSIHNGFSKIIVKPNQVLTSPLLPDQSVSFPHIDFGEFSIDPVNKPKILVNDLVLDNNDEIIASKPGGHLGTLLAKGNELLEGIQAAIKENQGGSTSIISQTQNNNPSRRPSSRFQDAELDILPGLDLI